MFHFRRVDPHPVLRNYIKSYWLIRKESKEEDIPLRLVPDGYPELMFHFDDPFRFRQTSGEIELPQSCLLGQATDTMQVTAQTGSRAFFAKMYPWVPYLLFGIPQNECINIGTDLEVLEPSSGMVDLACAIRSAASFEEAVAVMEDFLIRKLKLQGRKNPVLTFASRQILESKGRLGMDELKGKIKLSHRYLEQLFQKGIGLSPKRYARIIRNKEIACKLAEKAPRNFSAFALDMGYYDQAHFIKDFKSITCQTPTSYLNYMKKFPIREVKLYLNQFQ